VLAGERTLESSRDIRIRNGRDEVLVHAARRAGGRANATPSSSSPRSDSPLKPGFEVASLSTASAQVERTGGLLTDRTFRIDASTRHDVVDPDGNVAPLRD
jgi:predicted enzyme related to lactoylglutathione lyase